MSVLQRHTDLSFLERIHAVLLNLSETVHGYGGNRTRRHKDSASGLVEGDGDLPQGAWRYLCFGHLPCDRNHAEIRQKNASIAE